MSILIPTVGGIVSGDPTLIDFGGVLSSQQGSDDQRLNRIGNRFMLKVEMPSLRTSTDGRQVIARLARAVTEGAIFQFPQSKLVSGQGAPVIDGAGQTGSTLRLRGFTPGFTAFEGCFFHILYGGRRYVHGIAADTVADAGGKMALPIWPMSRISPNDGAACEFVAPQIEGFLFGQNGLPWSLPASPYTSVGFTIREAK